VRRSMRRNSSKEQLPQHEKASWSEVLRLPLHKAYNNEAN
jgi:hypothetical protein